MSPLRAGARAWLLALVAWSQAGCGGPPPTLASVSAASPAGYITAEEAVGWGELPADAVLSYGPASRQVAELRTPEGDGPHPVAVVLHGGCWTSLADQGYMDAVAVALTEAGWATWNLEFRSIDEEGGAWPGIFRDVGAGIDHLREVADVHRLDLDRVAAVGHSSGGHLALWAAARHRIPSGSVLHTPDPLRLRAVVGLAAMADLEHYHALGIDWDDGCGDAATQLLGGVPPPDAPERVAQASPSALQPSGVPQLLLTGADDRAVPPTIGETYAAQARAAGAEVEHHIVDRAAHFELVAPWTGAWATVWRLVEPFLQEVRR